MDKKFANVIVDISLEKLDKTFQYLIPKELEEELSVGMAVDIPFGRGNRFIQGYILEITDKPAFDLDKLKAVKGPSKKQLAIEGAFIQLAWWIKENYGSTMIQALKTVLPVKKAIQAKDKKFVRLLLSREDAEKKLELFLHKNYKARARLLEALLNTPVLPAQVVTGGLSISGSVLKALEEQSIIEIGMQQEYRNPVADQQSTQTEINLNEEQQSAVSEILKNYDKRDLSPCLIHGITGSGKTEVYLELIAGMAERGKQAIVLIPEIALTYQTVLRFSRRFGNRVSIINSRLSAGERFDQFERAKNGEIDIMIGPRSALFTPFQHLGLIIMDEEHETSYKSESIPKYHARETAMKRAEIQNALVVLGSATPSMEAYYRALSGEYHLYQIKKRYAKSVLPHVDTVDMREELKKGNHSILSVLLKNKITERLEKKEQVLLFLNRRGYAGFVSCRSCGYVVKCPHCDISLASHNNGKLICHYCGYETAQMKLCPECGSKYIGGFKAGTQQIEEIVKKEYETARVLRMDADTTKTKDGHQKILELFSNQGADILIGTQMIVKGHDFPNVTLVGILAADMSLYADDYHAQERTFQLLTQAAGRAGRGTKPGEVVIQTYSPEHYAVRLAAEQNYEAFYEEEISYRALMGYPPVFQLLAVLVTSENEKSGARAAEALKRKAEKAMRDTDIQIIGVTDAKISKLNDRYRKVIYFKQEYLSVLVQLKNQLEDFIAAQESFDGISIQFDFNPVSTY